MTTLKWAAIAWMGLGMVACAGTTPRPAPFYDYNHSVLNADRSPTFARNKGLEPLSFDGTSWTHEAPKQETAPASEKAFDPPPLVEWRPDRDAPSIKAQADPTPSLVAAPKPKAAPLPTPPVDMLQPSAREMLGNKADGVLGPQAKPKPKTAEVWTPKPTPKAKAPTAPPKAPAAAASKTPPKAKAAEPVSEKIIGVVHAASFIQAIYKINNVDVTVGQGGQAIAELHASFKRKGRIYHATRPAVGDVVFFHNTFDRNQDGRNNDWYTHVGLVEGVDEDGTVHVLSYFDGRVDSFPINLEHPRDAKNKDKIWNARLRTPTDGDAPFTRFLGGELFASFGSLLGDKTELMVVDNWSPGMDIEGL